MLTTSTHRYPLQDWLDGQVQTIRRGDGVWPEYKKRKAMTAYLYAAAIRHDMRAHVTCVDAETLTFQFVPAPTVDFSDVPPLGSSDFDRLEAENAELAHQVREVRARLVATHFGVRQELGPTLLAVYERIQRGIEAGEMPPIEEGGYRMRIEPAPGGLVVRLSYDKSVPGDAAA